MQKLRGLCKNGVGVLSKEGTHLRSLLAISGTNSISRGRCCPRFCRSLPPRLRLVQN